MENKEKQIKNNAGVPNMRDKLIALGQIIIIMAALVCGVILIGPFWTAYWALMGLATIRLIYAKTTSTFSVFKQVSIANSIKKIVTKK